MVLPSNFWKGTLVLAVVLDLGHSYLVDMKRLNSQQVEAMGKLRELMEKEKMKCEPYMWENYSLAKWLQYHGFQVDPTCDAMKRNILWRSAEKIDGILEEDWSDMRRLFPYTMDTCDKDGRPIQYINLGQWDIASYLAEGKKAQDRFFRYIILWREEMEALVWKWCQEGKYVTQGVVIINMSNASTQKHGCLFCLQLYRKASSIIEPNYPNTRTNVISVGTPFLFRAVYWAFTPIFQSQMVLYGHDRSQWEAFLLESIAPDQMPKGLLDQSSPVKQESKPEL